ncbi:MAG TPA: phosphoribosylamine--glycine ligase [Thermomicrobiales bacterium]|nr:phosphoribosylamine--glycine ligase [Thermomicrobiales bacterium]
MPTNVLVVGSGAREHALVWKLAQSERIGHLYVAPGNAGTASMAVNLNVVATDVPGIVAAVEARDINLVVVGPEAPLAAGLADALRERGVAVFGPSAAGARIESSKAWAKDLMMDEGVPTAWAVACDSLPQALTELEEIAAPVVVKADGLAAGKGVVVCQTRAEAEGALRAMLAEHTLGDAGCRVLIEECLAGPEVSFLALVDGETVVPLVPACDYKRVFDADEGPNTGGMGAYSPTALVDEAMSARIMDEIVRPVVRGMASRGIDYRGVLYAGLMLTVDGPKVIEFNCRFGDPETQVILPLLDADLVELCAATAEGRLADVASPSWHAGACVGIVVASGGYPGSYESGRPIGGLDGLPEGGVVFHAGTARRGDETVTAGGRVLTAVGCGADMASARDLAYATAAAVSFDGAFYRRDIALREIGDA